MDKEKLVVHYEKRKNSELFKQFQKEKDDIPLFTQLQNYIPIYNRFFSLNETNYNSVNLNNTWFLTSIKHPISENKDKGIYHCTIQHLKTEHSKKTQTFLKLAPLLDPFKYMIGKYNNNDPSLFALPRLQSSASIGSIHPKLLDYNNSAYVDGLFSFLSSTLIHNYHFINGVDYYGSFLGIKNQFKLNVADDLEYLCKSDFFIKNKNSLFMVEDYGNLYSPDSKKLEPIKISNNISRCSDLSIQSITPDLFEDIFVNNEHITLEDIKGHSLDMIEITNIQTDSSVSILDSKDIQTTIKSSSTCSSRTSHTSKNSCETNMLCKEKDMNVRNGERDDLKKCQGDGDNDDDNDDDNDHDNDDDNDDDDNDNDEEYEDEAENDSYESFEEEQVFATIPNFPVQVISMEHCESTFDDLIMNNDLTQEEWMSALMQIIMILITYQKAFSFTHNDLHTNNVMFNTTNSKYIYYCYKKIYYKVPTFGRIFKIIDFGRAIYKYNGNIFCSDSFQTGSDAATQYNTEPYFNDKKPRLEPNFSFDLCRLACSIFDYVIEDLDEIDDIEKCEPIIKIIFEWCLDDNGINILYKNNGIERYPDFKLYKMIARCVHHHIPQAQLDRPEFKSFTFAKNKIPSDQTIVNIDLIPSFG
uniref:Protein kinase domain-containing protein n=1 Tax=viral metagenome TaxID=1070528 RepID=A0A6C0B135_9ZZZZ